MKSLIQNMELDPAGQGISLPLAVLKDYLPHSIFSHLARPQFALRPEDDMGRATRFKDNGEHRMLEGVDVGEIASALSGSKGAPLWRETLLVVSVRNHLPEPEQPHQPPMFDLSLSTLFTPTVKTSEPVMQGLVLAGLTGAHQGQSLRVERVRVAGREQWLNPDSLQGVFNILRVGSDYITEAQSGNDPAQKDYLPALIRCASEDFSMGEAIQIGQIGLLRDRLPECDPRRLNRSGRMRPAPHTV